MIASMIPSRQQRPTSVANERGCGAGKEVVKGPQSCHRRTSAREVKRSLFIPTRTMHRKRCNSKTLFVGTTEWADLKK